MSKPEIGHPLMQDISIERFRLGRKAMIPLSRLAMGNAPGPLRIQLRDGMMANTVRPVEAVAIRIQVLEAAKAKIIPVATNAGAEYEEDMFASARLGLWWEAIRGNFSDLQWPMVEIKPDGTIYGITRRKSTGSIYGNAGYFLKPSALGKREEAKLAGLSETQRHAHHLAENGSEIDRFAKPGYITPGLSIFRSRMPLW